jgi:CBS-domain-containing membrane protein
MKAFGRSALGSLAILWVAFGSLGLAMTAASLVHAENVYPGWQWTFAVSVALLLGGMGILRRFGWARWVAVAAVAGGLAEAAAWLWWMWTPILIATVVFHTCGLVVLILTEFQPKAGHMEPPTSATNVRGRSASKEAPQ